MANLPQKPSQKRIDPVGRPVDGVTVTATTVLNRDPDRHYVLVYRGSEDFGIAHYMDCGYVLEKLRPGGPRLRANGSTSEGDAIEHRGHVLMSCEVAKLKERFAQEQAAFDAKERAIIQNREGIDPMRGINRGVVREGFLRVENETEAARQVTLGG